ncbi:MAG: type II toxin-antitoxin system HicB family antitoxin [Anaerolineales bacterium]|nr:type II toxin-antitoxin system HicB family antitoxin [Anaerolineales bacterium]
MIDRLSEEKMVNKEYFVIIERDEDGMYVGEVPQLRACYSQGKTLDELMANIREVIELCLEEEKEESQSEFIGVQRITV